MNPYERHPAHALWRDPVQGIVARISQALAERRVHAARTVVLVPYAQLMQVARDMWVANGATGFAPRFETTRNWASSAGGFLPGADDIAFDMARDLLTAQSLLVRAGFAASRIALAGRLVEIAQQLAPLAAAEHPHERAAWALRVRTAIEAGKGSEWFDTESALNGIALAWAANSAYATDVLMDGALTQVDQLIVLDGLQSDPLANKLAALFGERALRLPLATLDAPACTAALHPSSDPEDEAQRAAACVLRHLAEGRAPVALVATDRALTRRISAQLSAQGVAPRDETGWKLSTTRAAATLMSALRACAHDASSDQVLDWLKSATALDGRSVRALEARLRDRGMRDWRSWCAYVAASEKPQELALLPFTNDVEAQRATLARARPLAEWLGATRALLEAGGQWAMLNGDVVGIEVIAALYLDAEEGEIRGARCTLAEFTAWVRDVLEAASVRLPSDADAPQVIVLPLHQLLGRAFGAVVVPGCDDQRLPASPEPPGDWNPAQRLALSLPAREALEAAQRAAWAIALRAPHCDVLWRQFDASGEPVRPSGLVQILQLEHAAAEADDPRTPVQMAAQPTLRPQPQGDALLPITLSSTAYEDLRRCPYRFFALRQLRLRSSDELDAEVDKRDFGNWLHAVLGHFHEALKDAPLAALPARRALMAVAQEAATREFGLSEAEFLPFAAAWPAVRDGYLDWLAGHEAGEGAVFVEAEPWKEVPLGSVTLVGRLDRVDATPDDRAFVIDYKTESVDKTKDRVKDPTEDTQLAFYAALFPDDSLRAAYVNVGEKASGTRTVEQTDVVAARDALVAGVMDDLARIGRGAALPALGEGTVCTHCAARGLCRKDFWELAE